MSSTPTLVTHFQKLARYAVEEVGSKPIEPRTNSYMTVSLVVADPEPKSAAMSKADEADRTEWPAKCLFHRRTPPPSTDDGN